MKGERGKSRERHSRPVPITTKTDQPTALDDSGHDAKTRLHRLAPCSEIGPIHGREIAAAPGPRKSCMEPPYGSRGRFSCRTCSTVTSLLPFNLLFRFFL